MISKFPENHRMTVKEDLHRRARVEEPVGFGSADLELRRGS